ncbi:hypothetical protein OHT52_17195 [Streptomyces sp. NBC_00247]|uniref:hypothetical protein n=1 Tax=Streptomyces sp. NBC_00247 TaxID=2975689 RepID=UPI002E2B0A26|nr:hypothetical protein [Streptomyces sp. NBC_00247]
MQLPRVPDGYAGALLLRFERMSSSSESSTILLTFPQSAQVKEVVFTGMDMRNS